jgi:hypothetical protein
VLTAFSFLASQKWLGVLLGLLLGGSMHWLRRPFAVLFPVSFTANTVGEMVLHLTSVREHQDSGYRWTRNEITLKVRLIIAENLGVPLDDVRPETTFRELG